MTREHWLDGLVAGMREDRKAISEGIKDTYKDIYPLRGAVRKPSPKQELQAFMGLSQEERLNMAIEMGPEGYSQYVMDKMKSLVNTYGHAAQQMLPYLLAPANFLEEQNAEPDRDTMEAEIMGMLGANQ